jgi:phage terminase large subunit-like protein
MKDIGGSYPVIFGIDYASTADKMKDKERDYFAMAILRAIPGGGLVLVDGYRGHISKGEGLNLVISYWGIYPTLQKIGVETIGTGKEFYNDLVFMQDVNGRVPPLMSIPHHSTSKGKRFEEWLAPRFQMSRIWVADTPSPFVQEFKNEWMLYPNTPHDDCLDAVYMAALVAEGYMPSKADRSFNKKKDDNPLKVLFDYSYYKHGREYAQRP